MLVHGVAVLALLLSWPEARAVLARVNPIEVSLLQPSPPPEPARPLPVQAAKAPPQQPVPPPQVTAPQPLPAVTEPVAAAPVALLASSGPTAATMQAAPAPVVIAPRSAPVEAPRVAATEPLIEARFDADYLSNPSPAYPVASRRLGEAGVVHVRVQVGVEGQALKVELKSGSGFPRLDQSALDTVARWRFVAARRGAQAVTSWVVVPIVFSLN